MTLCKQAVNRASMDPSATHRRRELARMVEAGLYFFGVADVEQFEGLLDDAEQRAMLRDWLRSDHCPRGTMAADVKSVARASAELQVLGNELRAMELNAKTCA